MYCSKTRLEAERPVGRNVLVRGWGFPDYGVAVGTWREVHGFGDEVKKVCLSSS